MAWWRDHAVRRKSTSGASATVPVSRRATSAPRVTEPTNRRARKRQENKPSLSTLIARIVPGAVRECDVPVPPYSAFRLLSSLSYSHAWPFAVAKATQVCTRNRASPIAVEEPPPSRDPTTRPLRRSPRHPRLPPPTSVHVIVWCGDTPPVVLRLLDDRCERHKRASRAWSARWPASPKGDIESEPRGPSQLRGVRGVARIAPSQLRIVTIRHDLKVFVIILPCLVILAGHFRARMDLPKKSPS